LDRVIKKCLAKDPDERWESAADATSELVWIRDTALAPIAVSRGRRQFLPWAIAAIMALVAALAIARGFFRQPASSSSSIRFQIFAPEDTSFGNPAPVISPDGLHLAFVARDSSGKGFLWVRSLDSASPQKLE